MDDERVVVVVGGEEELNSVGESRRASPAEKYNSSHYPKHISVGLGINQTRDSCHNGGTLNVATGVVYRKMSYVIPFCICFCVVGSFKSGCSHSAASFGRCCSVFRLAECLQ